MVSKKKRTKLKSLSQGRPPTVKPTRSISSKATRTLIRTHHTLEKERAKALAAGNDAKAAALAKDIEMQGGIENYQRQVFSDRQGNLIFILICCFFVWDPRA